MTMLRRGPISRLCTIYKETFVPWRQITQIKSVHGCWQLV